MGTGSPDTSLCFFPLPFFVGLLPLAAYRPFQQKELGHIFCFQQQIAVRIGYFNYGKQHLPEFDRSFLPDESGGLLQSGKKVPGHSVSYTGKHLSYRSNAYFIGDKRTNGTVKASGQ